MNVGFLRGLFEEQIAHNVAAAATARTCALGQKGISSEKVQHLQYCYVCYAGVSLTLKVPLLHNVTLVIYFTWCSSVTVSPSYIFLFLSATPHHLLIPTWLAALNAIY